MVKAIMHGASGRMGRMIAELCASDPDIEIAAGVDVADDGTHRFPMYTSIKDCDVSADVVIDFSTAKAIDPLLSYCRERKLALVLCTTGLSDEQLEQVEELKKHVPVLRSANMSLGINVLLSLLKKAALVFSGAGFDIEVVERHHNKKLDAPSGTAIAMADSMNDAVSNKYHYTYDRSERREERDPLEIGISAVRGGNIVGDHEVIFAGVDEVVSFRHQATSRAVFGKGAIEAAKFLAGKPAGSYDMQNVIEG